MSALGSPLTRSKLRENSENANKRDSISQHGQSSSPPPSNASSNQARGSIELALPLSARDHIINSLNQFSSLLFRPSVSKEVKEHAVKQTNGLMTALIGLASSDAQRSDGERPKKKKKKKTRTGESAESNVSRPFFLIPLRLRSEILDQLIGNMDAVCYPIASLDESVKNRMRKQNNSLNIQLLSLPVTLISCASADESNPFDQPPSSLEVTLDKFGQKLDQKLDQTVATSQSELLATLSGEFRGLRESMQKLETTVQRFEAGNSEITMNYELKGVESFFGSNGRRYSKSYMCSGCPWSIQLGVTERKEEERVVQYLGFYLRCEHICEENERCSIRACYDLILLSPPNAVVKQLRYNYTFKELDASGPRSMGNWHFISYDDLKSKEYIQNDQLKVRIELRCDQLVVE